MRLSYGGGVSAIANLLATELNPTAGGYEQFLAGLSARG
jgi:hypothetical protein